VVGFYKVREGERRREKEREEREEREERGEEMCLSELQSKSIKIKTKSKLIKIKRLTP